MFTRNLLLNWAHLKLHHHRGSGNMNPPWHMDIPRPLDSSASDLPHATLRAEYAVSIVYFSSPNGTLGANRPGYS